MANTAAVRPVLASSRCPEGDAMHQIFVGSNSGAFLVSWVDRIADAIVVAGLQQSKLKRIALDQIPLCGTNSEVLQSLGFDASQIVQTIITSQVKSA